jgi:hypothetical protein
MDPRVTTAPAGIRQMFDLEMQLAGLVTSTSEAVLEARSIRDQLSKRSEQAGGSTRDSIEAFRKKLQALTEGAPATGESSPPALNQVNSAVSTLYGAVGASDATPTAAQVEAAKKVEQDATTVMKQWKELKANELPSLNLALHGAGLPELRLDSTPSAELEQGDEE